MDCDQVFMILTRGPFPTGEIWDEEVESHLEYCADCWRLAEALRPALEVFQEAVPPSEGRDLPGYWGDARPASAVVTQLVRSSTRTALSERARLARAPRPATLLSGLKGEFSGEVFRAMAIAATVTAAALATVSFFWN
jgi:hypothetical protein